jgi:hypothetical protein
MNTGYVQFCHWTGALCAASALLSTVALAAPSASDAQARYQQERAMCESGKSHQDRATCLREAGAALDEARRGRLEDSQVQYQKNALIRCDPLPPAERKDCIARMQGQGTTRGSVEAGGIYRELVTRETAGEGSASGTPQGSGAPRVK